jgi:hypothetical protein
MYIIFVGTTQYINNLKSFLANVNHTLLEGSSTWEGKQLDAQVIICFNRADAKRIQEFCLTSLKQESVPIKRLVSL